MCTTEYSTEELAMLNGTQEVEGDEFEDDEFENEEGTEQDEDGGEEGNPWAWAEGLDPTEIQKSHTKFTQRMQEISAKEKEYERMRDELSPLHRLRDQLEKDPGLVKAIEHYFATEGRDEMGELSEVRQELDAVKNTLMVEKELATVVKWVRENDLPMFDEDALLAHAAENRILNLKAAYRDMNFDQVQDRKAEQLEKDIKKGKQAGVPKSRRADSGGKTRYSEDDIAAMSDEDFQKNFGDIYESFVPRK